MSVGIINISLLGVVLVLLVISVQDFKRREVGHRYLLCLIFLMIVIWFDEPNFRFLPYSIAILAVGLFLHIFKILGAGDSKLMFIISLGINPDLMVLYIYMTIFLGGLLGLAYLVYGYFTDLELARRRGVPYAVPISICGGAMILLSHIS